MQCVHLPKGDSSRTYVHLLRSGSDKWANWDPPKPIKVGAFGTINHKSGEFIWEGSVYDDPEIREQFPVEKGSGVEELLAFKSARASCNRQEAKAGSQTDNVGLTMEAQFTKGRGAILVMHQVHMAYLPDELLQRLSNSARLKNKHLVTLVHTCKGYAYYLSSGESYSMTLTLEGNAAALSASGAAAWRARGERGTIRQAYNKDSEEPLYTPLYDLKEFRGAWGPVRGGLFCIGV